MRRARVRPAGVRDRFLASDPGLLRLLSALSTVCAVLLTLGALAAVDASVPILVTGALTAMVSTVAVTERRPRDQALTLAAGVPVALVVVVVGSALTPYRVLADVVFVAVIFTALYIRRLGPRATTLGVFAFQLFFVTQFVGTRLAQLPHLVPAVLVAFTASALVRFALLRSPPERTLMRLHQAFRLRLALMLDALIEVVDGGPGTPRAERAADDLRRQAARLHAGALMIQSRLETGTPDRGVAATIQRRVAEAETAAERLAVLVLRLVWPAADIDTLTRHPTPVHRTGSRLDVRVAVWLPALASKLRALRAAVRPDPRRPGRTDSTESWADGAKARDRLLGHLDDEPLSDAPPAVQDALRSAGDFACALSDLRLAVDAQAPAPRETPEAARSAKGQGPQGSGPAEDVAPEREGRHVRPTTRTALQVATGSALAVVGGELLSPQRWYWAVFTCWVVFISTSSTGDVLVRGYRRLVGTVTGVVAGLALAALIGGHPWPAFALAVLSVFGMYYTATVSYTLMSFFVTTMIGMLYALLHALTPGVLVVRIEETALGIACGLAAALLVLPAPTRERTDRLLREVLERLRAVLARSLARLCGEPDGDLLGSARALDAALDGLRLAVQPLITPLSPLRSRRRTALAVLGLLETAALHTRSLAGTAELMPAGIRIGTEHCLVDMAVRIDRNLAALIGQTAGGDATPLERGPGTTARPALGEEGARAEDVRTTRRVLRHLERVDRSVQGLARTLGVRVRDDP
ncbi:FUSC family protein [Streptomyces mexicanus]|uniref:FUSC family protein n=1 Tax=Streptomyces mexicanus TaxID=178566 RepID=A0A7X1LS69_9ACTN|nr:FUSC family protein [Streptomyces mexicanus]MBC2866081.1 FUSC family protein [Streptomyces mexicanus]